MACSLITVPQPAGLYWPLIGLVSPSLYPRSGFTTDARDPQARDRASTLALYRRIAMGKCKQGLSEACETAAAQQVEALVLQELYTARSQR